MFASLVHAQPAVSITAHFADLRDLRLERTKAHDLATILVIAICASIAGANDRVAVAEFGRSKQAWFRTFLDLPNGIPSRDTFWRVFRALDPDHFQTCFLNWIRAKSPLIKGQVIAIDGKQLRRSHDKGLGRSAICMVSAWATANHLVLGQRKVADESNEITAIPELLRALDLADCQVTIDAIGCQTAIAQLIVDQNADYLLALKANQGQLYDDVALLFADLTASQYQAHTHDYAKMSGKGHGRIEIRQAWTISDPSAAKSTGLVGSHEQLARQGPLRWRQQLQRENRDRVIVFVDHDYGIFHTSELLVLSGVPVRGLPPHLGSRDDNLRRYGCLPDG